MPLTPTSAKGIVGVMVEAASGEQLLLAATPIIATMTGITAPTGSTGMLLHLIVTNWTTSGSLTITGTGNPGNTETINIPAPTAQQLQSAQLADFEYVSVNAYTTITNITSTGLTNGTITVKGIQAPKYNVPVTAFKSNHKVPLYSTNAHTGLFSRDVKLVQTHNETTLDSFNSDFYGDISLYWAYAMLGLPTTTTLPAAPVSLFAATVLSATQSLSTQPTSPGMKLILTITAFTVAGTITINGTSYGVATSEVISITGAGTYYSANVYTAINAAGIVNATTAATLAITGVFGWKMTFNSESVRQSLSVAHYDGSASWIHPFGIISDGDFTIATKSETKLTLKGIAQDKLPIGDRTTNPLQVNRLQSLGIPLSDLPMMGWQTQVYFDAITGTAQTTINTDPEDIKIAIKATVEPHYTFNNQQEFTRAYPMKPSCTADISFDIVNLLQYEQFRQNLKQYMVVAMLGEYIGTTGGTTYYKSWTWTLPGRYDSEYAQEGDPGKGNVFAKPKWLCEYDPGIGAAYQLAVVTRNPPTYAS